MEKAGRPPACRGAQGHAGPAWEKQEVARREQEVLPGRACVELSLLQKEHLLGIGPGGARKHSPPAMHAPISTQRAPVFSLSMSGTSPGVSVSAVLITRTSPHADKAASGTVIVCAGSSP